MSSQIVPQRWHSFFTVLASDPYNLTSLPPDGRTEAQGECKHLGKGLQESKTIKGDRTRSMDTGDDFCD